MITVGTSSNSPQSQSFATPPAVEDTKNHGSASTAFGYESAQTQTGSIATFKWDSQNHMTESIVHGLSTRYTYDGSGERVLKTSSLNQTQYPDKNFQAQIGGAVPKVTKHIFVGTQRIASKLGIPNQNSANYEDENTFYYHADHLGSTEWVTDYKGRGYEHFIYTPHGESWISEEPDHLNNVEYRYSGKELDEETGLYYFGARYLNPRTGLWLSNDPAMGKYFPQAPVDDEAKKANGNLPGMGGVFNPVNLNGYHYAGNNPIKYLDPDGNETNWKHIFADLQKIEIGREIIGAIKDGKLSIYAADSIALVATDPKGTVTKYKVNGYQSKSAIYLNLARTDEEIAVTLVHEYAHFKNQKRNMDKTTVELEARNSGQKFGIELGYKDSKGNKLKPLTPEQIESVKQTYDTVFNKKTKTKFEILNQREILFSPGFLEGK